MAGQDRQFAKATQAGKLVGQGQQGSSQAGRQCRQGGWTREVGQGREVDRQTSTGSVWGKGSGQSKQVEGERREAGRQAGRQCTGGKA
jgi:hypothetical protein